MLLCGMTFTSMISRVPFGSLLSAMPARRRRPAAGNEAVPGAGSEPALPRLAFLHIEKTAGTSTMAYLRGLVGPDDLDPDPRRDLPPHLLSPFTANAIGQIRARPFVWGHYDLPSIERLGEGRFILALFREPRQRLLSLYHYWRAVRLETLTPEQAHSGVRAAHESTLLDFLRSPDPMVRDFTDHVYLRRLTGRYQTGSAADPLAADPRGTLAQAMAALERLSFIGIAENLDGGLPVLARLLHRAPPAHAPRENVLALMERDGKAPFRRLPREPLTAEVDTELDRLTRLDQVIYRAACTRFERLRHEAGLPVPHPAAAGL